MKKASIQGWIASLLAMAGCLARRPTPDPSWTADLVAAPYEGVALEERPRLVERWWTVFGDTQLDGLMAVALTNNLSLAQAEARLRQARLLAVQAGASRYPALSATASADTSAQRGAAPGGGRTTTAWERYGLGLAGSYELDVWGRVEALREAAALEALATEADQQTWAMTISGQVATRYFEWLAQVRVIALLERQVETSARMLNLLSARYARGRASSLDVLQQQRIVAETEAWLPGARAAESLLRQEMAVLLGLPPQLGVALEPRSFPVLPPLPDLGMPATLLEQRPDVRAAALRLERSGWQVRAAGADRLPALRLTASATFSSDELKELFDNWLATVAANLAAPLLDGGRRRAEVERMRAMEHERLAAYRDTLIRAVQDVQAALVREQRGRETLAAVRHQVEVGERTRSEAMRRYGRGLEPFLSVLTAELALRNYQRQEIQAEHAALAARVQLCRALGGDWQAILAGEEGELEDGKRAGGDNG